ncbi:MAG: hypothetical protein LC656_03220, partial [Sphingomonadales bacterium]|nr:hypothetical protein [Sphingomonadales bacterium]
VNTACDYANLSKQSAYALRARDPVFAAGWNAAAELARESLAEAVFERAIDGTTETIRKDGKVIAERHRFDNRLAMAVLARLDRRCDRSDAARTGHGRAKAEWDRFLDVVGAGDDEAARAILMPPSPAEIRLLSQASQVRAEREARPRVWWDATLDEWRTDYAHPNGNEDDWTQFNGRPCTPEESELLDAAIAAAPDEVDEEAEADLDARTAYFEHLRVFIANPNDDAEDDDEAPGDDDEGHSPSVS